MLLLDGRENADSAGWEGAVVNGTGLDGGGPQLAEQPKVAVVND